MSSDSTSTIAQVFTEEIPEIRTSSVKIRAIARKAGYRIMVALQRQQRSID